jgi:lipocalin
MKNLFISLIGLIFFFLTVNGQKVPSGNPKDFKIKTCLHSVSYMGIWRGQATYVGELARLAHDLDTTMVRIYTGYERPDLNTLKEIGYRGYIAYEMCEVLKGGGSIENLDKSAKSFLKYVKQFK